MTIKMAFLTKQEIICCPSLVSSCLQHDHFNVPIEWEELSYPCVMLVCPNPVDMKLKNNLSASSENVLQVHPFVRPSFITIFCH